MNRRNRTLIVLLVSLLVAGGAAFAVYRVVSNVPIREVEVSSRPTVVAALAIPVGTRIGKEHLKVINWPANSPVTGGFEKPEEIVDRGVVSSFSLNEPITEGKLAPREAGAGLPPTIPEGMRAISVRVNEVIGVAGFVVPGTRVDVLVTIQGDADSMTRVVVDNVRVLTAGTAYNQEQAKEGEAMRSSVVTLMVTPEQAEQIALAASEGQLMLTLRNPMDLEPSGTQGVRTAWLFQPGGKPKPEPVPVRRAPAPAPAVVAAPPPPPPPPSVHKVEAIRAAKRTEEVVR